MEGMCSSCLLSIDSANFRALFSYIVWSVLHLIVCNVSRQDVSTMEHFSSGMNV